MHDNSHLSKRVRKQPHVSFVLACYQPTAFASSLPHAVTLVLRHAMLPRVMLCCASLPTHPQARAALEEHIEQHGVLGLPHEAVRAAFGLPPSSSLMSEARGQAVKAATPKYNATQVCVGMCETGGWLEIRGRVGMCSL